MTSEPRLRRSQRWFRLLLWCYPADFRQELGQSFVETYTDQARAALRNRGRVHLAVVWLRALRDAATTGLGERLRPAGAWRTRGWGRDAALATRRLWRTPAFLGAVVGTLTVGLGAFAVVYTVVQQVLIAPLPYRDADDLYVVWRNYGSIIDLSRGWLSGPDLAALQSAGGVIEDAAVLGRQRSIFASGDGSDPIEIAVMVTSPNLFPMLGVLPVLGRVFDTHEVGPARPPIVVLTHAFWTRLGGDPALIGRQVRLSGEPFTVVGVLPAAFGFVRNASLGPPQPADAYVPFNLDLTTLSAGGGAYTGLIRAKAGTDARQVHAAVDAVGRDIDARHFKSRGLTLYPVGLKADLVAPVRPALLVLAAAGGFLLLVLTVNLASVLLARTAQREHELAVSRALGADGIAIARAAVTEGGLLGMVGGVTGTLLAVWGTQTLVALAPLDLPRREAIAVDWAAATAIVGVATLLGLLAGLVPAVWASRAPLATLLAASGVRGGGGQGRMRRGMVVVQVALSLVLLTAGGLVVQSFERLLRADPGFAPNGVVTMRVPMPTQLLPEARDALALQQRITDALAALPGVTAVSATETLPMTAGMNQTTLTIPGAPGNTGNPERDQPLVDYTGVRAGYVEAMGMHLLEGRAFGVSRPSGVREAIVDHVLAQHFFPTGSALGATIPFGENQAVTIVGVVQQARLYDLHQDGRPQLYVRAEDFDYRTLYFVFRTARPSGAVIPEVRSAMRGLDPRLAIADVRTMPEILATARRQQRMSAVLVAGFALAALLLASMGLFSIVSGSVTRRRHEFAVRLAVGASPRSVLRLAVADGARLVAVGIAVAIPGVLGAGELVRSTLVGVSPHDPMTLAIVAGGLVLVALTACYLPARKVLRIDPAQALRAG